MKNQSFIFLIIILIIHGCSEDFLERTEPGKSNLETFYTDEKAARQAVVSCYSHLDDYMGRGWIVPVLLGNSRSDDSEVYTSVPGWDPDRDKIGAFDIFPDNSHVQDAWQLLYRNIRFCNIATDKIPDVEFETQQEPEGYSLKNRLIAEARVLRAFFYFNLVNNFGGVPVVITLLDPSEYKMPRDTEEEVWMQIETDLRESIPHLPLRDEYADEDLGRITKGAAQSVLVKALVYQAGTDNSHPKWQEAYNIAKEIIGSGQYELLSNFAHLWDTEYDFSKESIFEAVFVDATNESGHWAKYHSIRWHTTESGDYNEWWGFGNDAPTQDLVDAFEKGTDWEDPRLQMTIWRPGDTILHAQSGKANVIASIDTETGYNFKKPTPDMENLPTAYLAAPKNPSFIRYADLLLLAAEAAYYSGDENTARTYVNQIRERARTDQWGNVYPDALPDINSSGKQLLLDIWHERRVELAGECHRFYDLKRQNRLGEVMRAFGKSFQDNKHELLPIPSAERNLNPNLEQNPNY